ncbi:MAG: O-antigen ligase family protein [Pseudomonadaceae bacterium]|nr:O-antigen ligase family protein [Pseudomonadaceae bacterium]
MVAWSKESSLINILYAGFLIFFCAPWVLTSNTPYQKLIIAFVWLPALVHVCCYSVRYKLLSRGGVCLYIFASLWFSFVVLMHAQDVDDFRELKMPFYIGLTLLGSFAVAQADIEKFKKLLLVSAVLGGFGAWASWVFFYLIEGQDWLSRHATIGLWRVIIPAAQAVGALMLLAVCLGLREASGPMLRISLVVALSGYCVFLIAGQARGVWLALCAALFLVVFLLRNRQAYILLGVFVAVLLLVFFINGDIFLARGGSFRSELWGKGVAYAADNWLVGIGFEKIWMTVGSGGATETQHHPHNMFIDIAVRFGLVGLLSWLMLWGWAMARAYRFRYTDLGQAALVLLVYSSIVVLTDGVAQWIKPNPGWFVTWLPLALAFALGSDKGKCLSSDRAVIK